MRVTRTGPVTKAPQDEYRVFFKRPPGVTNRQVKEYIEEALRSWGGGLDPEDPFFHSLRPVRVEKVIKR